MAKGDLVMIKNIAAFQMQITLLLLSLDTAWSLSQQGHLQPHSKSKAWQLGTQLKNGLLGGLV